jgi:hypothetical protein
MRSMGKGELMNDDRRMMNEEASGHEAAISDG